MTALSLFTTIRKRMALLKQQNEFLIQGDR